MRYSTATLYSLSLVTALLAVTSASVAAPANLSGESARLVMPVCAVGGAAGQVKALGKSSLYNVQRDFSGGIENGIPYPAGTFGPEPLFKTTFTAGGTGQSCVLANLSVNAQPNDNGMVFQVRLDGVPMLNHWNPSGFLQSTGNIPPGFNVPIVWISNVVDSGTFTAIDPPHLAAYSFFANVSPGTHTVEVLAAGCCHEDIDTPAGTPDGYIRSATLTLQYR